MSSPQSSQLGALTAGSSSLLVQAAEAALMLEQLAAGWSSCPAGVQGFTAADIFAAAAEAAPGCSMEVRVFHEDATTVGGPAGSWMMAVLVRGRLLADICVAVACVELLGAGRELGAESRMFPRSRSRQL